MSNGQTNAPSRITPTCVGNTVGLVGDIEVEEDHPHLRGEYRNLTRTTLKRAGSPPLAWGIPNNGFYQHLKAGITPTCVGNTQGNDLHYLPRKDHPHLRGEYWGCFFHFPNVKGSPPLAWGIPAPNVLFWFPSRITPTCVGNTANSV